MYRQGEVENWGHLPPNLPKYPLLKNQIAHYHVKPLHAFFIFFPQQEEHLFFPQFLPQFVFFFTNTFKYLLLFLKKNVIISPSPPLFIAIIFKLHKHSLKYDEHSFDIVKQAYINFSSPLNFKQEPPH